MRKAALILLLGSMSCSLFSTDLDESPVFRGLSLDPLSDYEARFELHFEGGLPWTYSLGLRRSPEISEYALALDGLGINQDPGDVRAVLQGDVLRMRGPGTDEVCVQVSADWEAGTHFLTPDDLIDPAQLVEPLVELGQDSVVGIATTHYATAQERLGSLEDVEVDVWIDPETGATLRYDLRLRGPDPVFGTGPGDLSGSFEVVSIDRQVIEPIAGCGTDLPLPEDAARVTLLPGLVSFESALPLGDLVAFFQTRLSQQGWLESLPADVSSTGALLGYVRDAETLEINLEALNGRVSVEMFQGP